MAADILFHPGDSPEEIGEDILEDFGGEIVTIVDEDGKEHAFEELARVELPEGVFIALVPLVGDEEDEDEDEDEFIILQLEEEDGEAYLSMVEDEALLEKAAKACADQIGVDLEI
jgi:uncharacterized protein YrzB (UPF0473 family)